MYKTELHCHTAEVSVCATESAENTVEKYIAAGYSTVVLTNHYSIHTRFAAKMKGIDFTDYLIDGYRKMRDYAGDRLNVLLGAEVTFEAPSDRNDYLVYGLTEEFLYEHKDMLAMNIETLFELCNENNFIVVHAHPIRPGHTLRGRWQVHGYEIMNGSAENNNLALMWAKYNSEALRTAGSDHHGPDDYPTCGILTDEPITTNKQLFDVLSSGNYHIFGSELATKSYPLGMKK